MVIQIYGKCNYWYLTYYNSSRNRITDSDNIFALIRKIQIGKLLKESATWYWKNLTEEHKYFQLEDWYVFLFCKIYTFLVINSFLSSAYVVSPGLTSRKFFFLLFSFFFFHSVSNFLGASLDKVLVSGSGSDIPLIQDFEPSNSRARLSHGTLRIFSLAEHWHTQIFLML